MFSKIMRVFYLSGDILTYRNLYGLFSQRLRILYTKILDVLDQIPKNAAYRKYTEQITNDRLATVKAVSN